MKNTSVMLPQMTRSIWSKRMTSGLPSAVINALSPSFPVQFVKADVAIFVQRVTKDVVPCQQRVVRQYKVNYAHAFVENLLNPLVSGIAFRTVRGKLPFGLQTVDFGVRELRPVAPGVAFHPQTDNGRWVIDP